MYKCTAMDTLTIGVIYMLMSDAMIRLEAEPIRERTQMFQRFILHQNYARCSELMPGAYVTCRVYDESDEKAIGNECVYQPCEDTSFNKTCLPLSTGPGEIYSYTCLCQDQKKPQLTSVEYHWSQWHSMTDPS